MFLSYLKFKHHFIFLLCTTFFFIIYPIYSIHLLIFWIGGMYVLRRKNISLKKVDEKALYSPVDGKVISIRPNTNSSFFGKNQYCLEIFISPFNRGGVHFPFSGEVHKLKVEKSRKSFIFNEGEHPTTGYFLTLKGRLALKCGLLLPKGMLPGWPKLWIMPEDIGEACAYIGHIFPGERIFLYMPASYEILVKKGDKIQAGLAILGKINE